MMDQYFDAFQFASRAHRLQTRKVDHTPYIAHPMAVAFTVAKAGGRCELVVAAVLHDVLEDTATTAEEIDTRFGDEVLGLVQSVSENKTLRGWKERKQRYVEEIGAHGSESKLLSAADKLHNLYSMKLDQAELGEALWSQFKAGKAEQEWFYRSLLALYENDALVRESGLASELHALVDHVFR